MKKSPILWLLLSAAVMLLLPWLTVTVIRSDAGMTAVLLLFFAVNPGYSLAAGHYAGKQIQCLWWVPGVSAVLFLVGAWLVFEPRESAFWTYAGAYFALGMEAMLVSRLITGRRENNG